MPEMHLRKPFNENKNQIQKFKVPEDTRCVY